MTEINKTPTLAGFLGTVLLWALILILFSLFAAYKPKTYKTVQIRLDSAPAKVVEKGEPKATSPEPVKTQETESGQLESSTAETESQPQKAVETPPSLQNAEETPKTARKSQPKTETAPKEVQKSQSKAAEPPAPAPVPSHVNEPVIQKSIDELMAEQNTKKQPKKKFNWDDFDDDSEGVSSSSSNRTETVRSAPQENALSGSAASASSQTNTAATSTSQNARATQNQNASKATSSSLGMRAATEYSAVAAAGVTSSAKINASEDGTGKIAVQMTDGTPRTLLEPESPKIRLSEEAANSIDSTKRMTIVFVVTASGNVPMNGISISPDILPSLVTIEIKQQISQWRFASADTEGTAKFEYTIKKE